MTRDEAIKRLRGIHVDNQFMFDNAQSYALVDALTALDLLKVEEPKAIDPIDVIGEVILGPISNSIVSGWRIGRGFDGADRIICALNAAGLTIVRKEDLK